MFSKEKKPHFRKIILNVNMIAIFIGVLSMLSGSRLPAIILLLLKLSNAASLVNNGTEILLITFLATVTPAASTVTQFAQVHDKNAAYAGAINIMTTLLCIVTMPIFVILYYI
jgi:predicted permease